MKKVGTLLFSSVSEQASEGPWTAPPGVNPGE